MFVKKFVGGRPYNIEDIKKSIPPEREEEFKVDVRRGLSQGDYSKNTTFPLNLFIEN